MSASPQGDISNTFARPRLNVIKYFANHDRNMGAVWRGTPAIPLVLVLSLGGHKQRLTGTSHA